MAARRPDVRLVLAVLSVAVLISGGHGLFNLRPLLGREYVRPTLQEDNAEEDLSFRGDILGDAVIVAAREVDSQRTKDAQGAAEEEADGTAYTSRLHAKHRQPLPEVKNDSYFALTAIRATKLLQERLALSGDEVAFRLPLLDLAATRLGSVCPPHHGAQYPTCDPQAVYRTADGTCNNAKFSWWGSAKSAFVRLLPPDYGDKVDSPRLAVDGAALPSSRLVSAACLSERLVTSDISERISLMVMQWGQFIDHDLSHTPMNTATLYGSPISCCGLPAQQRHPDCYPIPVPRRDSLRRDFGQTCMEFVRSVPAVHNGCGLGPREQVNQVTSYIDGSAVYGNSAAEMSQLRQFEGGQLKMANNLLPTTEEEHGCIRQRKDVKCFQAGDIRVNEQPDLTTLHTLWLREHNRVAGKLQRYCTGWSDEKLFQESRRLISAMLQHVTYREWLPLVVGGERTARHDLEPLQDRFYNGYSPNVDATIANVFATGAMRFGHTLVPDQLMLFTPWHTKLAAVSLHKSFFRPHSLYHPGRIDEYMAGLANANSSEADNYLVDTIRNKLFARLGSGFGLDLGALNIQRGRDHGLPSYTHWRTACGLSPVSSFSELKAFMNPRAVAKLITTYKDLADVDLYVGGLLETPLDGALVGPTLACLMAHQFQTLKRGDRFWYENGDERHSFTPDQLTQLRKVTLSKVICDNSALATIQTNIMFKPDDMNNQRVKCRHLPGLDLRVWASQLGCAVPVKPPSRPGSVRPPPFWPGGRPGGGGGGGGGWPTGYPGQASGPGPNYWPDQPQPGPAPVPAGMAGQGQTPGSTGIASGAEVPAVDPGFEQTPSGPTPTQAPAMTMAWTSSESPGVASSGGPAGGVTPSSPETGGGAAPVTTPAEGTDDSVERPVFPGSEPTEPVQPTGGPGSSDYRPPSWQPQPPSQAPSGSPPSQPIPVDPPVRPPSQLTLAPAVIPVDPPVLPPSKPFPGPTPGPLVPVDPPILPPSKPTPGPSDVILVDPPILPPSKPTPGPNDVIPVDPLILPPSRPTPGPNDVIPVDPPILPPGGPLQPQPIPVHPPLQPIPLPTPGPNQPIHPPVLPPAPVPLPDFGVEVLHPLQPPAPAPRPTLITPTPTPTMMMMSAMTLTIPATLWPSAPGKQLVIVAGTRTVVTIIPVPRPAIDGPSSTSFFPPLAIFPSRHSMGTGETSPGSGRPTMGIMSMTPAMSTMPTTSVAPMTMMKPVMPVFPPGFDPDYPVIPPGESIEIEPTDTGPSGGETTVTIPDLGTPDYPDYGKPVVGPVYPDIDEPVGAEYPDYGGPIVDPEYPDYKPVIDPLYPDYGDYGGEEGEVVTIPTAPTGTQTMPSTTSTSSGTPDFDYPVIPPGETIAIEPTDTDYDDGWPTVVSIPSSVLPGGGGPTRPTPPQLEPSVQQMGSSAVDSTSTMSTPTSYPAASLPEMTPFLTGATLNPSISSFLTGATLNPSISSLLTGATLNPSFSPFLTGATLNPSISSFLTGATLNPSISSILTGATLDPSRSSFLTGATLKPSTSSFLTGATLNPSISSFLTGATLKPSVTSFLTGATLRPSITSFLTGATLKPSITSFLTGATLKPSITSFLTGATLKPSITSFLTGATLKPSTSSFLTGATLKPSISSFLTGATLKPSIVSSSAVITWVSSITSTQHVHTLTTYPYHPFTSSPPTPSTSPSQPSRPRPVTTWLTFDTTVITTSGQLVTTIRPGLTAVTVRPTATMAPAVVTSIVWSPPRPAVWPPRPRPGPPVISIIAGPTPTMAGVHRPGATLTIESAAMGGWMPPPSGAQPRPTATLTVTVTALQPGRPGSSSGEHSGVGGYPRPGAVGGGYPRPGGAGGGYPRPGGVIGGYPRPGGTVGGYPRPGGSNGGYPRPGGSNGGYPRPGGTVGGYPRPGGTIGGYPWPGGLAGGYPMPGGVGGGYPKPPLGGYPRPKPPTVYPRPGEPQGMIPEDHSDTSKPQTNPTSDVKPMHILPEDSDIHVQTKPIGDVKPIPVLPAESETPIQSKPIGDVMPIPDISEEPHYPVQTKPIGDIKPIPVLPAVPEHPVQNKPIENVMPIPDLSEEPYNPVQTKPIGDVKPIPVLPAEPHDQVQTKPIGDLKPIPVLPSNPSTTKPTGASQSIVDHQTHPTQTKPDGHAQPMPVHPPHPDFPVQTKPIGDVKPIPVLPPLPEYPVQTKPIGDVKPIPVLPPHPEYPVQTKPIGDVKPIPVLPPHPEYPVQTKPIGDVKPIPVLPPHPDFPVQTKPIGDVKPIPVLPPHPDFPVQTKPIGDVKPIPVLPPHPEYPVQTKPIGDVKPIPVLPPHSEYPVQTKPIGDVKPIPVLPPHPDYPVQTKPIGDIKPIPVLPPHPEYPVQTKPIGDVKPIPVLPPNQGQAEPEEGGKPVTEGSQPSPVKPAVTTSSTTADLSTSRPTTAAPWTPRPTTATPSTPRPTTAAPWKPRPTTATPSTPRPTTAAPWKPRPTTAAPWKPRPTTAAPWKPHPSKAPPAPVVAKCEATGAWRWIPGMSQWCATNCLMKNPPFCPPSHCRCW